MTQSCQGGRGLAECGQGVLQGRCLAGFVVCKNVWHHFSGSTLCGGGTEGSAHEGRRAVSFLGVFWFSGLTAIDTGHSASTVIMLALFSTRPLALFCSIFCSLSLSLYVFLSVLSLSHLQALENYVNELC